MGWPGPATDRQMLACMAWLGEDWNRPNRQDFYLMQIACEVARVLAKHPEKIAVDRFKLRFGTRNRSQAEAVAASKAVWAAVLGRPATPPPQQLSHEVGP